MRNKAPIRHIGETYLDLTIIDVAPKRIGIVYWLCRCICGKEKEISTYSLGKTNSCGCYHRHRVSCANILRNTTHGRTDSKEYKMLYHAKERSLKSGVPFNLCGADIFIPEKCPILGITLKVNKGSKGFADDSPSLDRRVPELGYVKGNVYVISMKANRIKSNHEFVTMQAIADYMSEDFNGFGKKELPYFNPIF